MPEKTKGNFRAGFRYSSRVNQWLMGGGGGDGDAHVFELGAGAALFFSARITLHNIAEFLDAGILLTEFEEGHALFVAGGGEFEAFGVIVEDLVVLLNGLFVLMLRVGDFAEIKLRVGSEVGVAVVAEVILKFGAGKFVFAVGDVAKTVGVERVRGRRWTRRGKRGSAGAGGRGRG